MEKILIEYSANVDGLKADLETVEKQIDGTTKKITDSANLMGNELSGALKEFAKASGNIDLSKVDKEIDKLVKDLPKMKKLLNEFNDSLSQMDQGSEEFKQMNLIVKELEKNIKVLSGDTSKTADSINNAGKSAKTATVELRSLTEQSIRSGEIGTKAFFDIASRAAESKDRIGDVKEAIRVLSSDTFKLDALADGFQQGVAAAQLYEGAMALIGGENEEVAKSIQKLVALQNIAQGAQQLLNFARGQSAAILAAKRIQIGVVAAAENLYTIATTGATAATRAFSIAIAATGIGALVIGIGLLVSNWDKLTSSISDSNDEVSGFSENIQEIEKEVQKTTESLVQVKSAFEQAANGTITKEEALKKYNDTLGDTFGRAKTLEEAEALYAANTPRYLKAIAFRAAAQLELKRASEILASTVNEELGFLDKSAAIAKGIFSGFNFKEQIKQQKELNRLEKERDANEAIRNSAELEKRSKSFFDLTKSTNKELKKQEKQIVTNNKKDKFEKREKLELITDRDAKDLAKDTAGKLQNEITNEAINSLSKIELASKIDYNVEPLELVNFEQIAKAEILKKQVEDLFQFANQGLLLEIGLNPQSVNNFKLGIENLSSTLSTSFATQAEKVKAILDATANLMQASAQLASDALFANDKAQIEERKAQLQQEQEAELQAAEGNEQQKDAIKQKYAQKQKELKRKEAENDKKKAIFDATIATAVAVVRAGVITPLAILTAVLGAAQIALIASKPLPKFAKGGEVGGKPHSAGGTIIEAEKGEYIVNKKQTAKNYNLIKAINLGRENDFIEQSFVTPRLAELAEQKEKRERDLLSLQSVMIQNNMKATLGEILITNQKTNTILKTKSSSNFSL